MSSISICLRTRTTTFIEQVVVGRVGRPGTAISITTGDTAFVIKRMSKELAVDIRRMEPRGGVYAEPIVGENRRGLVTKSGHVGSSQESGKKEGTTVQKKVGTEVQRRNGIKVVNNVEKGIEDLKNALKNNDMNYLEDTLGSLDDDDVNDEDNEDGDKEEMQKNIGEKDGKKNPKRAIKVKSGKSKDKGKGKKKVKKAKAETKAEAEALSLIHI